MIYFLGMIYHKSTPVFVDIDPHNWCLDPISLEKRISEKTKAIIVVHTFGQVARMNEIIAIGKKYNLKV